MAQVRVRVSRLYTQASTSCVYGRIPVVGDLIYYHDPLTDDKNAGPAPVVQVALYNQPAKDGSVAHVWIPEG